MHCRLQRQMHFSRIFFSLITILAHNGDHTNINKYRVTINIQHYSIFFKNKFAYHGHIHMLSLIKEMLCLWYHALVLIFLNCTRIIMLSLKSIGQVCLYEKKVFR